MFEATSRTGEVLLPECDRSALEHVLESLGVESGRLLHLAALGVVLYYSLVVDDAAPSISATAGLASMMRPSGDERKRPTGTLRKISIRVCSLRSNAALVRPAPSRPNRRLGSATAAVASASPDVDKP